MGRYLQIWKEFLKKFNGKLSRNPEMESFEKSNGNPDEIHRESLQNFVTQSSRIPKRTPLKN